jgi:glutathione-regulated potassium-efflux system ancillary protein KefG
MLRILILFAHPALEKSSVHARLIKEAAQISGVTLHDLYEAYPDFDVQVAKEQQMLLAHDIIVWQHPFYWYSAPALLKQWLDLVLEHGWAYGSGGIKLAGKRALSIISCGGSLDAYSPEGRNRFTIPHFLAPFEQTAHLCKMTYMPPFVVPGTHRLNREEMEQYALQYRQLLEKLVADPDFSTSAPDVTFLNNLVSQFPMLQL